MKILLALLILSPIIFITCSQKSKAKKYTPDAKKLFDSAGKFLKHPGNEEKAIVLLEQATQIDSNYYEAYFYKKSLQLRLNLLNDALITTKNLIRLEPEDYEKYMSAGFLYWRIGDSVSAIEYFNKGFVLFENVFDTIISKPNTSHEWILFNRGIYLLMIGKQEQGNKILRELCDNETNKGLKKEYQQFLNKTRKEILNDLFNSDTANSTSEPFIKN